MFICSYVCVFNDASLNKFMHSCVCVRATSPPATDADEETARQCQQPVDGKGGGREGRRGRERRRKEGKGQQVIW